MIDHSKYRPSNLLFRALCAEIEASNDQSFIDARIQALARWPYRVCQRYIDDLTAKAVFTSPAWPAVRVLESRTTFFYELYNDIDEILDVDFSNIVEFVYWNGTETDPVFFNNTCRHLKFIHTIWMGDGVWPSDWPFLPKVGTVEVDRIRDLNMLNAFLESTPKLRRLILHREMLERISVVAIPDHVKNIKLYRLDSAGVDAVRHGPLRGRVNELADVTSPALFGLLHSGGIAQEVKTLIVRGGLERSVSDHTMKAVMERAEFRRLLDFRAYELDSTENDWKAVRHAEFRRLRRLSLVACKVSDDLLHLLSTSACLPQLRQLSFLDNQVGPNGVARLIEAPWASQLTTLCLAYNPIQDEGAALIANTNTLCNLEELHLANCGISPKGAEILLSSAKLPKLRRLNLSFNQVKFGNSQPYPLLEQLESLDLASTGIDDEAFINLFSAPPNIANLLALRLFNNQITAIGMEAASKTEGPRNLLSLELSDNNIGDAGLKALARSAWARTILDYGLLDCEISRNGVRFFTQSEAVARAENIDCGKYVPVSLEFCDPAKAAVRPILRAKMRE